MTTCKRFALFAITIQSLFNHCLTCRHLPLLIVDDGSMERDEMVALVPNATFVWKHEKDKGHDKSMNMIRDMTSNYTYLFHLEDDWQFIHSMDYVRLMISILEENPMIGQVLVNQNYAEIESELDVIKGGIDRGTHLIHQFDPNHELLRPGEVSNGHWPHYSLRPGLLRRSVLDMVGSFDVGHLEFERAYGIRYMNVGYETAFLKGIHSIHLGKKSWEMEVDNPSAYVLNNVRRYH